MKPTATVEIVLDDNAISPPTVRTMQSPNCRSKYPPAMVVRERPRLMRDQTAADFLEMSVSAFRQRVKDRRLPQPIRDDGIVRWDRRVLERFYDEISGLSNLQFEGKDTSWEDLLKRASGRLESITTSGTR